MQNQFERKRKNWVKVYPFHTTIGEKNSLMIRGVRQNNSQLEKESTLEGKKGEKKGRMRLL